jgi:hypothetical protein
MDSMIGNRQKNTLIYRLIGGTLLLALTATGGFLGTRYREKSSSRWTWPGYLLSTKPSQSIRLPSNSSIAVGDPLFLEIAPGVYEFAGDVVSVNTNPSGEKRAQILWRNSSTLPQNARIEFYETPRSLVWIARTLLPPEKKKKVIDKILAHYQAESPKINAKLMPVLREVFEKSIPIIEKSALDYVRSQRSRVQGLGQKYQEELVRKKLIPLLRRDVMPIVEKHAVPVVEKIGEELWDRASLWRFGWRYAYDVLPLTNRNLVQAEWRRFVEEEAIPVVESHFDELVDVQKKIIVETTANPAVRTAIQESIESLIDDKELRALLSDILQHAIVNNQELHQVLQEVMQSEQAGQLSQQFEASLQPLANEIGVELFGTETDGLTPELVAVLRSQILGKDQRWLVVRYDNTTLPPTAAKGEEWIAEWGQDTPLFPFQNADLELRPVETPPREVSQ